MPAAATAIAYIIMYTNYKRAGSEFSLLFGNRIYGTCYGFFTNGNTEYKLFFFFPFTLKLSSCCVRAFFFCFPKTSDWIHFSSSYLLIKVSQTVEFVN